MKWLTRDLTKEFLLIAPPPRTQSTLLIYTIYGGPQNQGKLYGMKAYYGSLNLKIFRTLADSKCLILSVKFELGQLA